MPIQEDTKPWYKQMWPWILISLPMSAVIAGIITFMIAIDDPDGLVVEEYYKEGKAIKYKMEKAHEAERLNLRAMLRLSTDGQIAELDLLPLEHTPETLTLQLRHATRAHFDQVLTMARTVDGNYRANLEKAAQGKWRLYLEDEASTWQLHGTLQIPNTPIAQLTPQSRSVQ